MQSFKVQVREEQRTQECLKQLAQCYRELNRLPKVSELDEMAQGRAWSARVLYDEIVFRSQGILAG